MTKCSLPPPKYSACITKGAISFHAFAKIAFGLPGDFVTREGRDVLVNGERIASTKPLTKRGDPLTEGPLGVVPEGCVFAATHHKDGFDSRYSHIGFVCRDRLVGTGVAIL